MHHFWRVVQVRVFGEGSAIEGIDEVLQSELGAEVSHFDQLNGVRVAGKAYLTAETALHYLANFGAVLNPIGLTVTQTKSKESNNHLMNILLFAAVGVAFIVMASLCTLRLVKYFGLRAQEKLIEADIAQMEDIEQIAQEYENTVSAYKIVKEFADGTVSDNEMVYQLILDIEKCLPTDARVDAFQSEEGLVVFEVTGTEKDEIADMIVSLKKLDYVDSVMLTDAQDENAPYFLEIVDPVEDDDLTEEEAELLKREVVFPITVQLRNRKGTELSDEVAAAISGVTAADLGGGGETAEAITVEEVIE